jgi:cytochrome c-type biogenesis protein CcmF
LVLFTDAAHKPWALTLFVFAAFALSGLAQEFWNGAAARRRLAGGSTAGALVGVVSRNRRRYGGYIIHAGIAVLLIGIAASSSFQTNRNIDLRPGQSEVVDGREVTYERPTVHVTAEYLQFGAVLRIVHDGKVSILQPTRRYFRPTGGAGGGTISSYFDGEATSEVGLEAGAGNDFWTAVQPDITAIQRRTRLADKGFESCVAGAPGTPPQCDALGAMMRAAAANPSLEATALEQINKLQGLAANRIAQSYLSDNSAATFKVIVNPLVTWMWIGGLIALAGALIALWPTRGRRRGALVRTEADAQKEAKYREIRDAELDHAAGKLSDQDFALLDAELRREAVEILDRVENGNGAHVNGNGAAVNGNDGAGEGDEKPEKVPQG